MAPESVLARLRGPRGAAATFAVVAVASIPLAVVMGDYRWFALDDWTFLNYRELDSVESMLEGHGGHWVTVPAVIYRLLYAVFGIRTYLPYELVAIVSHLGVAVAVRAVLRRSAVRPWPATAVASLLVLFGPGSENIVTAFQISFTLALGFGLAQYLLADHPGSATWRDVGAVACGLVAMASSGVAISVLAAAGVALLVRWGWRRAALQVVPVATAYVVWYLAIGARDAPAVPSPSLRAVAVWLRRSAYETAMGFGENRLLAAFFVVVVVGGLLVHLAPSLGGARRLEGSPMDRAKALASRVVPIAMPLALLGGAVVFALATARQRWVFGVEAAAVSRYRYVYFALLLPALGVSLQAIVDRWRRLTPVLAVALVAVLALNARPGTFPPGPFTEEIYRAQERSITTITRIPEAQEAPTHLQPFPILVGASSPTIGFLNGSARSGRLDPSTGPIPPTERNEYLLRLGVSQQGASRTGLTPPPGCDEAVGPEAGVYPVGTEFWSDGRVEVSLVREDGTSRPPAVGMGADPGVVAARQGARLRVEMPGLRLRIVPTGIGTVRRCRP